MTDLLYTDVEEDLQASVAALLGKALDVNAVVALYDGEPAAFGIWSELVTQIGLGGLGVPESEGGSGAGVRELVAVAESLGAAVAPVPFLTTAVMAATILDRVDAAPQIIQRVVEGEVIVPAAPFNLAPDEIAAVSPGVHVAPDGLRGRVTSVADGARASAFLVATQLDESTPELHLVEARDVQVTEVPSLDMTRPLADLSFAGAPSTCLSRGDVVRTALTDAYRRAAAVLAGEQLGVARWCLDSTVAHVKDRRQFGRAIGSFQAVKHRLADVWVDLVHATAVARYVADCLQTCTDEDVAVSLAQAWCSRVAVDAAEAAVQLHGGLGMTWEHPTHLYLKKAKADQVALGSPGHHRAVLAGLVDLRAEHEAEEMTQ